MLSFRFERGGDRSNCYRKMKRRQRAHLGFMGRKRDTMHGVVASAEGETAPERKKEGDDES
jgi:hypothetical protein